MTNTMRVVEISEPGGPEVLEPGTRPRPEPGEDEVLIEVAAAGINRPDVFQRKGLYPPPPGASDIPGLEVAGTVAGLGGGVKDWQIGDRLCALVAGGGYAEFATAPKQQCLPLPAGLSFVQGAAIPETFFTVWTNVFDRGRLRSSDSLLIHGGTSGIGTTAIQLASAMGSIVYATAGSDEKCEACKELGATVAVNYKEADFVQILKDETGGKGVDVILDMVAGDYVARNLSLAAVDGRIVIIAFLGGSHAQLDLRPLMVRRLTLTGSTLRPQSIAAKGAIAAALRERVWPLIEAGRVKPRIFQTFGLEQASEAHALMESSVHIGKIVLEVS